MTNVGKLRKSAPRTTWQVGQARGEDDDEALSLPLPKHPLSRSASLEGTLLW